MENSASLARNDYPSLVEDYNDKVIGYLKQLQGLKSPILSSLQLPESKLAKGELFLQKPSTQIGAIQSFIIDCIDSYRNYLNIRDWAPITINLGHGMCALGEYTLAIEYCFKPCLIPHDVLLSMTRKGSLRVRIPGERKPSQLAVDMELLELHCNAVSGFVIGSSGQAKHKDPLLRSTETIRQMLQSIEMIRNALRLIVNAKPPRVSELLYHCIYNLVCSGLSIVEPLLTVAIVTPEVVEVVLPYLNFMLLSVESSIPLNNTKYVQFRLRIYGLICRALDALGTLGIPSGQFPELQYTAVPAPPSGTRGRGSQDVGPSGEATYPYSHTYNSPDAFDVSLVHVFSEPIMQQHPRLEAADVLRITTRNGKVSARVFSARAALQRAYNSIAALRLMTVSDPPVLEDTMMMLDTSISELVIKRFRYDSFVSVPMAWSNLHRDLPSKSYTVTLMAIVGALSWGKSDVRRVINHSPVGSEAPAILLGEGSTPDAETQFDCYQYSSSTPVAAQDSRKKGKASATPSSRAESRQLGTRPETPAPKTFQPLPTLYANAESARIQSLTVLLMQLHEPILKHSIPLGTLYTMHSLPFAQRYACKVAGQKLPTKSALRASMHGVSSSYEQVMITHNPLLVCGVALERFERWAKEEGTLAFDFFDLPRLTSHSTMYLLDVAYIFESQAETLALNFTTMLSILQKLYSYEKWRDFCILLHLAEARFYAAYLSIVTNYPQFRVTHQMSSQATHAAFTDQAMESKVPHLYAVDVSHLFAYGHQLVLLRRYFELEHGVIPVPAIYTPASFVAGAQVPMHASTQIPSDTLFFDQVWNTPATVPDSPSGGRPSSAGSRRGMRKNSVTSIQSGTSNSRPTTRESVHPGNAGGYANIVTSAPASQELRLKDMLAFSTLSLSPLALLPSGGNGTFPLPVLGLPSVCLLAANHALDVAVHSHVDNAEFPHPFYAIHALLAPSSSSPSPPTSHSALPLAHTPTYTPEGTLLLPIPDVSYEEYLHRLHPFLENSGAVFAATCVDMVHDAALMLWELTQGLEAWRDTRPLVELPQPYITAAANHTHVTLLETPENLEGPGTGAAAASKNQRPGVHALPPLNTTLPFVSPLEYGPLPSRAGASGVVSDLLAQLYPTVFATLRAVPSPDPLMFGTLGLRFAVLAASRKDVVLGLQICKTALEVVQQGRDLQTSIDAALGAPMFAPSTNCGPGATASTANASTSPSRALFHPRVSNEAYFRHIRKCVTTTHPPIPLPDALEPTSSTPQALLEWRNETSLACLHADLLLLQQTLELRHGAILAQLEDVVQLRRAKILHKATKVSTVKTRILKRLSHARAGTISDEDGHRSPDENHLRGAPSRTSGPRIHFDVLPSSSEGDARQEDEGGVPGDGGDENAAGEDTLALALEAAMRKGQEFRGWRPSEAVVQVVEKRAGGNQVMRALCSLALTAWDSASTGALKLLEQAETELFLAEKRERQLHKYMLSRLRKYMSSAAAPADSSAGTNVGVYVDVHHNGRSEMTPLDETHDEFSYRTTRRVSGDATTIGHTPATPYSESQYSGLAEPSHTDASTLAPSNTNTTNPHDIASKLRPRRTKTMEEARKQSASSMRSRLNAPKPPVPHVPAPLRPPPMDSVTGLPPELTPPNPWSAPFVLGITSRTITLAPAVCPGVLPAFASEADEAGAVTTTTIVKKSNAAANKPMERIVHYEVYGKPWGTGTSVATTSTHLPGTMTPMHLAAGVQNSGSVITSPLLPDPVIQQYALAAIDTNETAVSSDSVATIRSKSPNRSPSPTRSLYPVHSHPNHEDREPDTDSDVYLHTRVRATLGSLVPNLPYNFAIGARTAQGTLALQEALSENTPPLVPMTPLPLQYAWGLLASRAYGLGEKGLARRAAMRCLATYIVVHAVEPLPSGPIDPLYRFPTQSVTLKRKLLTVTPPQVLRLALQCLHILAATNIWGIPPYEPPATTKPATQSLSTAQALRSVQPPVPGTLGSGNAGGSAVKEPLAPTFLTENNVEMPLHPVYGVHPGTEQRWSEKQTIQDLPSPAKLVLATLRRVGVLQAALDLAMFLLDPHEIQVAANAIVSTLAPLIAMAPTLHPTLLAPLHACYRAFCYLQPPMLHPLARKHLHQLASWLAAAPDDFAPLWRRLEASYASLHGNPAGYSAYPPMHSPMLPHFKAQGQSTVRGFAANIPRSAVELFRIPLGAKRPPRNALPVPEDQDASAAPQPGQEGQQGSDSVALALHSSKAFQKFLPFYDYSALTIESGVLPNTLPAPALYESHLSPQPYVTAALAEFLTHKNTTDPSFRTDALMQPLSRADTEWILTRYLRSLYVRFGSQHLYSPQLGFEQFAVAEERIAALFNTQACLLQDVSAFHSQCLTASHLAPQPVTPKRPIVSHPMFNMHPLNVLQMSYAATYSHLAQVFKYNQTIFSTVQRRVDVAHPLLPPILSTFSTLFQDFFWLPKLDSEQAQGTTPAIQKTALHRLIQTLFPVLEDGSVNEKRPSTQPVVPPSSTHSSAKKDAAATSGSDAPDLLPYPAINAHFPRLVGLLTQNILQVVTASVAPATARTAPLSAANTAVQAMLPFLSAIHSNLQTLVDNLRDAQAQASTYVERITQKTAALTAGKEAGGKEAKSRSQSRGGKETKPVTPTPAAPIIQTLLPTHLQEDTILPHPLLPELEEWSQLLPKLGIALTPQHPVPSAMRVASLGNPKEMTTNQNFALSVHHHQFNANASAANSVDVTDTSGAKILVTPPASYVYSTSHHSPSSFFVPPAQNDVTLLFASLVQAMKPLVLVATVQALFQHIHATASAGPHRPHLVPSATSPEGGHNGPWPHAADSPGSGNDITAAKQVILKQVAELPAPEVLASLACRQSMLQYLRGVLSLLEIENDVLFQHFDTYDPEVSIQPSDFQSHPQLAEYFPKNDNGDGEDSDSNAEEDPAAPSSAPPVTASLAPGVVSDAHSVGSYPSLLGPGTRARDESGYTHKEYSRVYVPFPEPAPFPIETSTDLWGWMDGPGDTARMSHTHQRRVTGSANQEQDMRIMAQQLLLPLVQLELATGRALLQRLQNTVPLHHPVHLVHSPPSQSKSDTGTGSPADIGGGTFDPIPRPPTLSVPVVGAAGGAHSGSAGSAATARSLHEALRIPASTYWSTQALQSTRSRLGTPGRIGTAGGARTNPLEGIYAPPNGRTASLVQEPHAPVAALFSGLASVVAPHIALLGFLEPLAFEQSTGSAAETRNGASIVVGGGGPLSPGKTQEKLYPWTGYNLPEVLSRRAMPQLLYKTLPLPLSRTFFAPITSPPAATTTTPKQGSHGHDHAAPSTTSPGELDGADAIALPPGTPCRSLPEWTVNEPLPLLRLVLETASHASILARAAQAWDSLKGSIFLAWNSVLETNASPALFGLLEGHTPPPPPEPEEFDDDADSIQDSSMGGGDGPLPSASSTPGTRRGNFSEYTTGSYLSGFSISHRFKSFPLPPLQPAPPTVPAVLDWRPLWRVALCALDLLQALIDGKVEWRGHMPTPPSSSAQASTEKPASISSIISSSIGEALNAVNVGLGSTSVPPLPEGQERSWEAIFPPTRYQLTKADVDTMGVQQWYRSTLNIPREHGDRSAMIPRPCALNNRLKRFWEVMYHQDDDDDDAMSTDDGDFSEHGSPASPSASGTPRSSAGGNLARSHMPPGTSVSASSPRRGNWASNLSVFSGSPSLSPGSEFGASTPRVGTALSGGRGPADGRGGGYGAAGGADSEPGETPGPSVPTPPAFLVQTEVAALCRLLAYTSLCLLHAQQWSVLSPFATRLAAVYPSLLRLVRRRAGQSEPEHPQWGWSKTPIEQALRVSPHWDTSYSQGKKVPGAVPYAMAMYEGQFPAATGAALESVTEALLAQSGLANVEQMVEQTLALGVRAGTYAARVLWTQVRHDADVANLHFVNAGNAFIQESTEIRRLLRNAKRVVTSELLKEWKSQCKEWNKSRKLINAHCVHLNRFANARHTYLLYLEEWNNARLRNLQTADKQYMAIQEAAAVSQLYPSLHTYLKSCEESQKTMQFGLQAGQMPSALVTRSISAGPNLKKSATFGPLPGRGSTAPAGPLGSNVATFAPMAPPGSLFSASRARNAHPARGILSPKMQRAESMLDGWMESEHMGEVWKTLRLYYVEFLTAQATANPSRGGLFLGAQDQTQALPLLEYALSPSSPFSSPVPPLGVASQALLPSRPPVVLSLLTELESVSWELPKVFTLEIPPSHVVPPPPVQPPALLQMLQTVQSAVHQTSEKLLFTVVTSHLRQILTSGVHESLSAAALLRASVANTFPSTSKIAPSSASYSILSDPESLMHRITFPPTVAPGASANLDFLISDASQASVPGTTGAFGAGSAVGTLPGSAGSGLNTYTPTSRGGGNANSGSSGGSGVSPVLPLLRLHYQALERALQLFRLERGALNHLLDSQNAIDNWRADLPSLIPISASIESTLSNPDDTEPLRARAAAASGLSTDIAVPRKTETIGAVRSAAVATAATAKAKPVSNPKQDAFFRRLGYKDYKQPPAETSATDKADASANTSTGDSTSPVSNNIDHTPSVPGTVSPQNPSAINHLGVYGVLILISASHNLLQALLFVQRAARDARAVVDLAGRSLPGPHGLVSEIENILRTRDCVQALNLGASAHTPLSLSQLIATLVLILYQAYPLLHPSSFAACAMHIPHPLLPFDFSVFLQDSYIDAEQLYTALYAAAEHLLSYGEVYAAQAHAPLSFLEYMALEVLQDPIRITETLFLRAKALLASGEIQSAVRILARIYKGEKLALPVSLLGEGNANAVGGLLWGDASYFTHVSETGTSTGTTNATAPVPVPVSKATATSSPSALPSLPRSYTLPYLAQYHNHLPPAHPLNRACLSWLADPAVLPFEAVSPALLALYGPALLAHTASLRAQILLAVFRAAAPEAYPHAAARLAFASPKESTVDSSANATTPPNTAATSAESPGVPLSVALGLRSPSPLPVPATFATNNVLHPLFHPYVLSSTDTRTKDSPDAANIVSGGGTSDRGVPSGVSFEKYTYTRGGVPQSLRPWGSASGSGSVEILGTPEEWAQAFTFSVPCTDETSLYAGLTPSHLSWPKTSPPTFVQLQNPQNPYAVAEFQALGTSGTTPTPPGGDPGGATSTSNTPHIPPLGPFAPPSVQAGLPASGGPGGAGSAPSTAAAGRKRGDPADAVPASPPPTQYLTRTQCADLLSDVSWLPALQAAIPRALHYALSALAIVPPKNAVLPRAHPLPPAQAAPGSPEPPVRSPSRGAGAAVARRTAKKDAAPQADLPTLALCTPDDMRILQSQCHTISFEALYLPAPVATPLDERLRAMQSTLLGTAAAEGSAVKGGKANERRGGDSRAGKRNEPPGGAASLPGNEWMASLMDQPTFEDPRPPSIQDGSDRHLEPLDDPSAYFAPQTFSSVLTALQLLQEYYFSAQLHRECVHVSQVLLDTEETMRKKRTVLESTGTFLETLFPQVPPPNSALYTPAPATTAPDAEEPGTPLCHLRPFRVATHPYLSPLKGGLSVHAAASRPSLGSAANLRFRAQHQLVQALLALPFPQGADTVLGPVIAEALERDNDAFTAGFLFQRALAFRLLGNSAQERKTLELIIAKGYEELKSHGATLKPIVAPLLPPQHLAQDPVLTVLPLYPQTRAPPLLQTLFAPSLHPAVPLACVQWLQSLETLTRRQQREATDSFSFSLKEIDHHVHLRSATTHLARLEHALSTADGEKGANASAAETFSASAPESPSGARRGHAAGTPLLRAIATAMQPTLGGPASEHHTLPVLLACFAELCARHQYETLRGSSARLYRLGTRLVSGSVWHRLPSAHTLHLDHPYQDPYAPHLQPPYLRAPGVVALSHDPVRLFSDLAPAAATGDTLYLPGSTLTAFAGALAASAAAWRHRLVDFLRESMGRTRLRAKEHKESREGKGSKVNLGVGTRVEISGGNDGTTSRGSMETAMTSGRDVNGLAEAQHRTGQLPGAASHSGAGTTTTAIAVPTSHQASTDNDTHSDTVTDTLQILELYFLLLRARGVELAVQQRHVHPPSRPLVTCLTDLASSSTDLFLRQTAPLPPSPVGLSLLAKGMLYATLALQFAERLLPAPPETLLPIHRLLLRQCFTLARYTAIPLPPEAYIHLSAAEPTAAGSAANGTLGGSDATSQPISASSATTSNAALCVNPVRLASMLALLPQAVHASVRILRLKRAGAYQSTWYDALARTFSQHFVCTHQDAAMQALTETLQNASVTTGRTVPDTTPPVALTLPLPGVEGLLRAQLTAPTIAPKLPPSLLDAPIDPTAPVTSLMLVSKLPAAPEITQSVGAHVAALLKARVPPSLALEIASQRSLATWSTLLSTLQTLSQPDGHVIGTADDEPSLQSLAALLTPPPPPGSSGQGTVPPSRSASAARDRRMSTGSATGNVDKSGASGDGTWQPELQLLCQAYALASTPATEIEFLGPPSAGLFESVPPEADTKRGAGGKDKDKERERRSSSVGQSRGGTRDAAAAANAQNASAQKLATYHGHSSPSLLHEIDAAQLKHALLLAAVSANGYDLLSTRSSDALWHLTHARHSFFLSFVQSHPSVLACTPPAYSPLCPAAAVSAPANVALNLPYPEPVAALFQRLAALPGGAASFFAPLPPLTPLLSTSSSSAPAPTSTTATGELQYLSLPPLGGPFPGATPGSTGFYSYSPAAHAKLLLPPGGVLGGGAPTPGTADSPTATGSGRSGRASTPAKTSSTPGGSRATTPVNGSRASNAKKNADTSDADSASDISTSDIFSPLTNSLLALPLPQMAQLPFAFNPAYTTTVPNTTHLLLLAGPVAEQTYCPPPGTIYPSPASTSASAASASGTERSRSKPGTAPSATRSSSTSKGPKASPPSTPHATHASLLESSTDSLALLPAAPTAPVLPPPALLPSSAFFLPLALPTNPLLTLTLAFATLRQRCSQALSLPHLEALLAVGVRPLPRYLASGGASAANAANAPSRPGSGLGFAPSSKSGGVGASSRPGSAGGGAGSRPGTSGARPRGSGSAAVAAVPSSGGNGSYEDMPYEALVTGLLEQECTELYEQALVPSLDALGSRLAALLRYGYLAREDRELHAARFGDIHGASHSLADKATIQHAIHDASQSVAQQGAQAHKFLLAYLPPMDAPPSLLQCIEHMATEYFLPIGGGSALGGGSSAEPGTAQAAASSYSAPSTANKGKRGEVPLDSPSGSMADAAEVLGMLSTPPLPVQLLKSLPSDSMVWKIKATLVLLQALEDLFQPVQVMAGHAQCKILAVWIRAVLFG